MAPEVYREGSLVVYRVALGFNKERLFVVYEVEGAGTTPEQSWNVVHQVRVRNGDAPLKLICAAGGASSAVETVTAIYEVPGRAVDLHFAYRDIHGVPRSDEVVDVSSMK